MPVKGLPEAPGSITKKEPKTVTIYLSGGIAYLTTWNRAETIKCYPGTSAVIPAHDDGRPHSGWLGQMDGEWTIDPMKADPKNRDVYALDVGVAKFQAGKAHVAALPGTMISVAEGQSLSATVGVWVKVSGKVAKAEPAETAPMKGMK